MHPPDIRVPKCTKSGPNAEQCAGPSYQWHDMKTPAVIRLLATHSEQSQLKHPKRAMVLFGEHTRACRCSLVRHCQNLSDVCILLCGTATPFVGPSISASFTLYHGKTS
jgi:hypothetical protein